MRVVLLLATAVVFATNAAQAAGASRLVVSNIATPQTAGAVSSVRVEARASNNTIVTTYTGTVRFASTDARAVLPANYQFTSIDQGVHVFTNAVTLKTAGTQSVTATDAATSSVTGSQTGIVVNSGPAATLVFSGIVTPRTAGVLATMTVELLDALGNRATGYRGTIHFGFGAPRGTYPVDYTFTATDAGIHTFVDSLNITAAGTWTITATDTANSSLTGAQTVQVNPGPAAQLIVSGVPSPTTAGFPVGATVELRDSYSNRATAYTGTVHFTSSDSQSLLPANYAFTSADAGIRSFDGAVTLKTIGTQTVTATDVATPSLTATQSGIQVVTNDAVSLAVSGLPFPTLIAGTTRTITVSARDAAQNNARGYAGTVHFTSTDGDASLPSDYTFTTGTNCGSVPCDNGSHQFSVTLRTSCRGAHCISSLRPPSTAQRVTAQDNVSSSVTGSVSTIVTPAEAAVIAVYGFPSPIIAGQNRSFVLQAQDVYGNVVDRPGNATVTFSDPQVPPMTVPISDIFQDWTTWFLTAGLQSISGTDGILPAMPQTGISVVPGPAFAFALSGIPNAVQAGSPSTLVVEAEDWVGNRTTDYAGSVAFTSTDPQATLPSVTSFVGAGGVKTFPDGITFRTAGTQSVTAVDTVDGTIVGTFEGISVAAGGAASFAIAISPSTTLTAGVPAQATVTARDLYGNVDTRYSGTIHFGSSDPIAVLPADFTFLPSDMGVATVSGVTFKTAGPQSLTATDTLSPSLNGTRSGITVLAASPAALMVAGLATPRTAGSPGSITVTALDAYGNIATGYLGTVAFTSSDSQAVLPAATAFVAADAGTRQFVVALKTAGLQSVTATDSVNAAMTASQANISVTGADAASLVVGGVASPIEGGAPANVVVDARDAYGNRSTAYRGTVAFSSSDAQATLPGPYTFLAADSGLHTFAGAVRFATAGTQSITATDTVVATITGTQTGIAVSDSSPPVWPVPSTLTGTGTSTTTAHLVWTAATDNVAVAAYRLYQNGTLVQTLGGSTLATDVGGLTVGVLTSFQVQAGDAAGHWTTNGPTTTLATVPPDPVLVAPPIDTTVSTNTYDASSFIYSGTNPVQTGVAPGTIQPTRVAVLRGTVHDRVGQPLPAVRISALGHPEFGQTFTRADGAFDFAVNGGGLLTVKYERAALLPAQRQVTPTWQEYTALPDVVLVPEDQLVSLVEMGSTNTQVARGSVSTDDIGSRQATIIFPPGTGAALKMPDGSTQTVGTLHIRATEITVGPNGPAAMPGPLPPSSAYTYAAAFTADEAIQAGAIGIQFSQPVFGYLENYLGFPVGYVIPSGTYDPLGTRWLPESNGKVVQVLGVTSGLADLDSNGDGTADDSATLASLGVSNAELAQLATLYRPGQTLWRVPLQHFSFEDWNVPLGIPDVPFLPDDPPPDSGGPPAGCPATASKCILEIQNQVLGETLPIVGTPYQLYYNSGRVPGRRANYRLNLGMPTPREIGISNAFKICRPDQNPECQAVTAANSIVRVDGSVTVSLAGRTFSRRTNKLDNPVGVIPPKWQFEWDGKDAYGRELQGEQPVTVTSCYNYPGIGYGTPEQNAASFGQPALSGAIVVYRIVSEVSAIFDVCKTTKTTIGGWNVKPAALGGWTISAQHMLDVPNKTVYRGDGGTQRVDDLNRYVVTYVAGTGLGANAGGTTSAISDGVPATSVNLAVPEGVVVGPDGSVYHSDAARGIVARITPDGRYHVFAGVQLQGGSDAEGVLASQADVHFPAGLALGADGTLYFVDADMGRIRKVTPDGRVFTVAGNGPFGQIGFTPDGVSALSATLALDRQGQIAVAHDGTIYFAETANHRVRKIGPDGILRTVAGIGPAPSSQGFGGFSGDGGPATQAALSRPQGVTLGPDGSIYIADTCNQRVRRVTPDGIIKTVAGSGLNCQAATPNFGGDGGPATSAGLGFSFRSMAVAADSTLFIGDSGNRVRRVIPSGTIDTVAGNGFSGPSGSGGVPGCVGNNCPASATAFGRVVSVAAGPGGELYAGLSDNMFRIARIASATAKQLVAVGNIVVPSSDASEVYVFDGQGRHLRTLDALSNTPVQVFGYDGAGRLTSITDRVGNVTIVQRDAQGNPKAIVGPYGQQTTISVDSDGYLHTVTNVNSEMVQMLYKPVVAGDRHTGGLLSQYTNPRGGQSLYDYDPDGFLTKDTPPDGSFVTLDRGGFLAPTTVTYRTALGRTQVYGISRSLTEDSETRTSRDPVGLLTTVKRNPDQSTSVTRPDGTSITSTEIPDPRFGTQAATSSTTTRTPSGLARTQSRTRSASLSNPNDPLSLASLVEQVTVTGKTSSSAYDSAARTITQVTPMGRQTVTTLDALGRVTQIRSPGTVATTIGYDQNGRPQTVAQGPRVTTTSYRIDGFIGSIIDPLLNTTTFDYDLAGRAISMTLPNSTSLSMTYDPTGNATSVTPPGRPPHVFAYTSGNQESDYVPPDVGQPRTTHTDFNLDQQVVNTSRPDGDFVTRTYDTASRRLTAVTSSRGTTAYGYSPSTGQVTSINTFDGVGLTYGYDGSLIRDVTWSGTVSGNVHRTYDSSFRIGSETVSGGQTINFGYDNDDLLTSAGAMTITRDLATGFVSGTTLGIISESRTYDSFGAEKTYTVTANGATLYAVDYGTRDALGRIVTRTEAIQGTTRVYGYAYDAVGRLTDVTIDGNASSHYEYDANGNRLVGPGLLSSPAYDAQDRLLSYRDCVYAYKNDGSVQAKTCADGTTTYDYDVFGNLRGVTLPSGTAIVYIVDGQNRRVGKKVNGVLVEGFLYRDQLQRVSWLNGDGTTKATFIYGAKANVPEYMIKEGSIYRLITDQVGTVRMVVDSAGGVAERIDYDEFGNVLSDSAPGFQPFGFAGGHRDIDNGLTRFGWRDYDPVSGRWVLTDPIRFAGGVANLYQYSGGDPVNWNDPTGLDPYGTNDCSYYDERCLEVGGSYYCNSGQGWNPFAWGAPYWCPRFPTPPPNPPWSPQPWSRCTRQCLQDCDSQDSRDLNYCPAQPDNRPGPWLPWGPSLSCHAACYTACLVMPVDWQRGLAGFFENGGW